MKKLFVFISIIALIVIFAGCSMSDPQNSVVVIPDTSQFIGEERAKEIALEKAGVTSENAFFNKVELDFDDGIWHYDIEFRKDRIEYDADIKADDGTVLSFEKDF